MTNNKYTINEIFNVAKSKGFKGTRKTISRDLENLVPNPENGNHNQNLYSNEVAELVINKRTNHQDKDINLDDELLIIKEKEIQKIRMNNMYRDYEEQVSNPIGTEYDRAVSKRTNSDFKSLEIKFMLQAILNNSGYALDTERLRRDIEIQNAYLESGNLDERDVKTIRAMNRLNNFKNYISSNEDK